MAVVIRNNIENEVGEKEILQQLLVQSEENNKLLKKIRSYQNMQTLMAYLKVLIIVVPIVLSIIYLPTILKPFWDQYQQAIGLNAGADLNLQNLQKTLNEFKK